MYIYIYNIYICIYIIQYTYYTSYSTELKRKSICKQSLGRNFSYDYRKAKKAAKIVLIEAAEVSEDVARGGAANKITSMKERFKNICNQKN